MIFTRTTGLWRKMFQIANGTLVFKSINNIHRDETLHSFQLYILSKYQPITEGVSCSSRFSTDCVTSSCNVSTSKRSRWVEEMQCETPWAEWELMKPWCKFCVASQPVFYNSTVQQSWKAPQEGTWNPPNQLTIFRLLSANHPYLLLLFICLFPVLLYFCQSFFPGGLVCVSDPCHLTPGLIRPVSQVSTFPACSLCPGAHRLACSSCST